LAACEGISTQGPGGRWSDGEIGLHVEVVLVEVVDFIHPIGVKDGDLDEEGRD